MSKRTVLFDIHKRLGAKFTEFGGWEMPVLYTGIVPEHNAVRNSAGVFDISHMGQIFVQGRGSLPFLQGICTNDISKCSPGGSVYSHLCNEKGGVVDDIFVYCLSQENYLVVVNAATSDKDFHWMQKAKLELAIRGLNDNRHLNIENWSDKFGMVALQGPFAEKIALKLYGQVPLRHQIKLIPYKNETIYICRTGYTGEDGFEIIAPSAYTPEVWDSLFGASKECGVSLIPCGLGARDTLRLEVGYLLYGQDVDDDHTPLEAGVPWVIKFEKGDFIGKQSLLNQKTSGLKRKLTAFKLQERGIPRHGSGILREGTNVGAVTSGTFSPSLQCGIALGYVPGDLNGKISIECHSKPVPAEAVKLPFYQKKRS